MKSNDLSSVTDSMECKADGLVISLDLGSKWSYSLFGDEISV
jgi:hypothetical protein